MQVLDINEIKEGEIYIGAVINADGTGNHIILLPGDKDNGPWQAAIDWAKELDGDLPTRVEQALLFDKFRYQFKRDWYWSNTTNEAESGWAWYQDFRYGFQNGASKHLKLRARAVRRLPI